MKVLRVSGIMLKGLDAADNRLVRVAVLLSGGKAFIVIEFNLIISDFYYLLVVLEYKSDLRLVSRRQTEPLD